MARAQQHRQIQRLTIAVLGVAVACAVLPSTPASGQGLFQTIFGTLTGRQRVNSYADPLELFPPLLRSNEDAPRGGTAYCVRMCDGYHFVLPRGQTRSTPAELCSSLCPAAATRLFYGAPGAIEQAVAANGQRYANLETALLYRDQRVPQCTCNSRGTGITSIDPLSDPTLREGDIVVTASGPVVFRGSRNWPYKSADFTPASEYRGLPTALRRELASMRIADPPSTPVEAEAKEGERQQVSELTDRSPPATPFWQSVVDRPPLR